MNGWLATRAAGEPLRHGARVQVVAAAKTTLAEALVTALSEMPAVKDDAKATVPTKTGGSYSYAYVTLDHLVAQTRPVLKKNGLAIVQHVAVLDTGQPVLRTTILHTSGETFDAGERFLGGSASVTKLKPRARREHRARNGRPRRCWWRRRTSGGSAVSAPTVELSDARGFPLPAMWAESPCARRDYRQRANVFACPERGCYLAMACLFPPADTAPLAAHPLLPEKENTHERR